MRIAAVHFVHPIAPLGGVDPVVGFVTSGEASLQLVDGHLRIAWKGGAPGTFELVPLANVRELQCVDSPQDTQLSPPVHQPTLRPAAAPQPKAKGR